MNLAERPFKITPGMEVAPPHKLLVSVYTVESMPIAYMQAVFGLVSAYKHAAL